MIIKMENATIYNKFDFMLSMVEIIAGSDFVCSCCCSCFSVTCFVSAAADW